MRGVTSEASSHALRRQAATAFIFASICGVVTTHADAQFGVGRPLYVGRRGTTVVLPGPGPGPLDPLSVAAYWGFRPNPVLARQPIGHQTIATSHNGYIYRPVYADDPTAAMVAIPNSLEAIGGARPVASPPAARASSEALFDAALVLFKAGRYEAALDRLNRVVDLKPDDSRAYLLMVQVYFGLANYEAAAEALAAALNNAPEYDWEKYVRGYKNYFASPLTFATHLRTLERFVALHPERFEGHLLLGYQYGCLGQADLALAELALTRPNVEADRLSRHFAAAGEAPAPAPDAKLDAAALKPAANPPVKRRGREF